MSIYIPKSKLEQRLLNQNYYIDDNSDLSPNYFNITHFPNTIGGGKSIIKLKGNGDYLRLGSDINIEVLDSAGNPMYWEIEDIIDRFKQYYISISVYDTTADGVGMVIITGEASRDVHGNPIPSNWRGKHNVIWTKNIDIKPFERNNSDIVFSKQPQVVVYQSTISERVSSGSAVQGTYTTASASNRFWITTTNFTGFDKELTIDRGITDLEIQRTGINPQLTPRTVNTVDTTTRTEIKSGQNAYKINKTNRYNTILHTGIPFFSASHIGGIFQISGSVPTTLLPTPPTGYTVSGSNSTQISKYSSRIVDVIDSRTAILETPITVQIYNQADTNPSLTLKNWTYKLVSQSFGGTVIYSTTTPSYVTSSVKQNYVEFTYTDLDPIAGQVYKIRPFYKLTGQQGDYFILNDQKIKPVEYLADPAYPNQTTYGKEISEYYLYGHFVEDRAITDYWELRLETAAGIGSAIATPPAVDNDTQIASVRLDISGSTTTLLSVQSNAPQNYIANKQYTISNYLTLDPYCELEVYMRSTPLQTGLIQQTNNLQAFQPTANLEKTRYDSAYSRFGKFIGKITNNTSQRVYYGKVGFDFLPNRSGVGWPTYRAKSINYDSTGSAYISQIGINSTTLNGFTPNLASFTIPFTQFPTLVLSQSVDFKLEYFDYTGNQSEYVTYLNGVTVFTDAQVNGTGCQAEIYSWTFDSQFYHMATQSYWETGSASGFKSQSLWPYAYTGSVYLYDYSTHFPPRYAAYYNAVYNYTTASLITSASNTKLKYWPSIEYVSGLFLIPGTMSKWTSTPRTDNYTSGHYRSTYNVPVFTRGYNIWGIEYDSSDISLWNVRRPILKDQNSDVSYYANPLYDSSGTALTAAQKLLYISGTIPMDPIGMACLADLSNSPYTGSLAVEHTNDYPPYSAESDGYTEPIDGIQLYYPYWDTPSSTAAKYIQPTWKFGSMQGKITSSWNWVSKATENFGIYNTPEMTATNNSTTAAYYPFTNPQTQPDYLGKYLAETASAPYSRSLQTSSIDNRWFPYEGCLGITRDAVSASYRDYNAASTNSQRTYALKQRRLMFPMNGTATGSYFTTNGGVYDVRFKVKQYGNYTPDTGSYLDVYIFNANYDFTSATEGVNGWRPPQANVVRVGNGYGTAPVLSHYDPTTGAWFNEYHVTLVQYGSPGQIVFEPGGVTNSDSYFGTLIDDVSFCKVGITTDPALIAQQSIYTTWTNINNTPGTATGNNGITE